MANYKEQDITGVSWRRCGSISIINPHSSKGITPSVNFYEEDIIDIGNGKFVTTSINNNGGPFMSIVVEVNPTATFDIYDPTTGQKVEGQTMTHAELYGILYSAYRTEAEKRDALMANSANPILP